MKIPPLTTFTYPIYSLFHEDIEKLKAFIKDLYEEFLETDNEKLLLPRANLKELDKLLKERYFAKSVKDDTYFGLTNDYHVNVDEIVALYIINDPKVMDSLYLDNEKLIQFEIPNEAIWYQNKNMIKLALESEDGINISGHTMQGFGLRFSSFLHIALSNIKKEKVNLNDSWYTGYLVALWWAGCLKGSICNKYVTNII